MAQLGTTEPQLQQAVNLCRQPGYSSLRCSAKGWNEVRRNQSWRTLRAAASRSEAADALPVLGMDLESARAYCLWIGKRLRTEDEWGYRARGREARIFPWGNDPLPPQPLAKQVIAQSRGGSWLLPQPFFQRLALRRIGPPGAALDSSFRCAASAVSWPDDRTLPP